ncbi:MAG: amidohydrolase family protein [Alphaproteobacteria bacterium]|nr:amidohydrolase family protein [Alphaproteobacteria bacterium]
MLKCSSTQVTGPHPAGCLCQSPAFALLNRHLSSKFSRRVFVAGAAVTAAVSVFATRPAAARIPKAPDSPIAFTNVRVFDGKSETLRSGLRVVVEGQKIKAVEAAEKPLAAGVQTIDGGGRVLMPGLIDAHWHAMMAALPLTTLLVADVGFITLAAADQAEQTLMRGFTSVRDMAGPSFSLKRAIDSGLASGPRIWPSGAMISQTGGHGDFRFPYEVPAAPNGPLSRGDVIGGGAIADGVDRVLQRAREQLMLGASQLKLAAGGGVSSIYDPIDVAQYTEPEFRAAVDAAENWGTYVAVHAYTPRAIQTAIRGGVRCIEHGQLMDETTAKIIADKGVWLSSQPFLANEYSNPQSTPEGRAKQLEVANGTDTAYGFAKKYKIKTAWGTDILFDPKMTVNQGAILTTMTRWYTPAEVLKMATGTNAELLAMAGPRNPYPGKLGVVEEGAWADLLLVDGDPLADIKLVADPDKNLKIIMKDGRIYKNRLAG